MKYFGVAISGTGSYTPERILTNHDLEKMVDTSDEWITTRTGIKERRIAADDEPTSSIALPAARRALEAAGIAPEELDLIIFSTVSPDTQFPNTACHLQRKLGATKAGCFALEAACSGFLYGLEVGSSLIRSGGHRKVLVVGAEKMSSVIDWTDRNTCVLFGDGAGAAVLTRTSPERDSLLASELGADGSYADLLHIPAGGTAMPLDQQLMADGLHYLQMNGREIFKLAVNAMVDTATIVMARGGITIDQVRWLVPHQANTRIIQGVGKRLGIPDERVFVNLEKYGNTSSATIPICIDEIVRGGQVEHGDYLLLVAFGAGLTWGAQLVRW